MLRTAHPAALLWKKLSFSCPILLIQFYQHSYQLVPRFCWNLQINKTILWPDFSLSKCVFPFVQTPSGKTLFLLLFIRTPQTIASVVKLIWFWKRAFVIDVCLFELLSDLEPVKGLIYNLVSRLIQAQLRVLVLLKLQVYDVSVGNNPRVRFCIGL